MTWTELLASELAITISNREVWVAIAVALLLAAGCWAFGTWVARTVGLLQPNAPVGENLAVGLAAGLMVLASWWAAIWSGGRSSFTPVAIGFAVALALAVFRRRRSRLRAGTGEAPPVGGRDDEPRAMRPSRRRYVMPAVLAGVFIVAVALFYGSTIALSPRDGVQPIIERDTAYYAILGRDLARTGIEINLSASGFSNQPGFPVQVWYHWGEAWLASTVIAVFGIAPMAARHFIVLPIALLAAATLAGTLVRRMAGTTSRLAYLFGVFVLLVLAPHPLVPGPFFSDWAVGLLSGITLFGMGAVAAIHAMYLRTALRRREPTWGLATFVGSAVAFILPAHIAIAILGLVGVAGVGSIRILRSLITAKRLPTMARIWQRSFTATVAVIGATVAWGILTGHTLGIGGGAAASVVAPFNSVWRETIVIITVFSGAFLAIPIVWSRIRGTSGPAADLFLGVMGLLVAGAIGWGAQIGEFTMFYLLFAGIAVYATPLAAVAVRMLRDQLRDVGHMRLADLLVILCMIQLQIGVFAVTLRLQGLGVSVYKPMPLSLLGSITQLPSDAKLAYACEPTEEIAFAVPQLLTIDAEAARRVVPMCFEAEFPSILLGAKPDITVVSQFFLGAPQFELYPTAIAQPSSTEILAFLNRYGIDYIYADARHPNTLVPEAAVIASSGEFQVLKVP